MKRKRVLKLEKYSTMITVTNFGDKNQSSWKLQWRENLQMRFIEEVTSARTKKTQETSQVPLGTNLEDINSDG